jgi:N-acetylglucosaminyl-diphospho-decaprenol L-rhamnosyltransferase
MNNIDLSIIILNYKTVKLIKYCVLNLKKLKLPLNYEIIVVDNHGQDGCAEMIRKNFSDVKYLAAAKNKGFAAGNNLGIKKAQGSYLLILNPDIAVFNDAIEKMYDFLIKNPEVGIIGPKLLNPDQSLQFSCGRFPDWHLPFFRRTFLGKTKSGKEWLNNYLMMEWDHKENKEVDWLFGACLMIRKEALEKVGLLDEGFFMYLEDADWCRRFWGKRL